MVVENYGDVSMKEFALSWMMCYVAWDVALSWVVITKSCESYWGASSDAD